jgi:hypothetical protein
MTTNSARMLAMKITGYCRLNFVGKVKFFERAIPTIRYFAEWTIPSMRDLLDDPI